ncbi:MAG: scaffolding protein [Clostridia bacterium]|nr:scaffolding protein [Clostridia bacterium]
MLDWLKTILGDAYTDDIDKQVSDQIGKSFVARADFNTLNETKKTLETTVKDRDTQLEELKKVDPAALQAKITELQTANTSAKADFDKQLNQLKLDSAVETRLLREGAVNTKAVKALLDSGKISLDGENILGLDDQIKAIKESDKWAFTAQTPPKSGDRHGASGGDGDTVGDEISAAVFGKTE